MGGMLGEICFVLNTLFEPSFEKKIAGFEEPDNEKLMEILRGFVENIAKSSWVLEIQVDEEIENEIKKYDPEFEWILLGKEYVNNEKDEESRADYIRIFKHFLGSDSYRKLFKIEEPLEIKKLQIVKVEEPGEEGGDGDAPQEDASPPPEPAPVPPAKQPTIPVDQEGEKVEGEGQEQKEGEEKQEEEGQKEGEEAQPVEPPVKKVLFGNKLLDAFLQLYLSEDSFTKHFELKKIQTNIEGEFGMQAFCNLMPDLTPPPPEPEEGEGSQQPVEPEPKEGGEEEEDEAKEPVIEEKPYIPPEDYRDQPFEYKPGLMANRSEELNVMFYNVPFAIWMRRQIFKVVNDVCGLGVIEEDQNNIADAMGEREESEIARYLETFEVCKVDKLFLNSY